MSHSINSLAKEQSFAPSLAQESDINRLVTDLRRLPPGYERNRVFRRLVKLSALFVSSKVRQYSGLEPLLVRQAAILALESAALTYDPCRGSFYSWANWRFKGFIRDEQRDLKPREFPWDINTLLHFMEQKNPSCSEDLISSFNLYLQESMENPYDEILSFIDEKLRKLLIQKFWHRKSRQTIYEQTSIPVSHQSYWMRKALQMIRERSNLEEKFFSF